MSWSISTTLKEHEKTDAKLQQEWEALRALVPSGNDHCPAERDEQVLAVEKALFDLLSDHGIFDHSQELVITVDGHANKEFKEDPEWANDFISINIAVKKYRTD